MPDQINRITYQLIMCPATCCHAKYMKFQSPSLLTLELDLLIFSVWDEVKLVAGELKQVISHCLVGVNGIPLVYHCPISIYEVTFDHNFFVADRLTADAILELDFLDFNKWILDLAKGKMLVADQSVSLLPKSHSIKMFSSTVIVLNTCVIPSHSEMEIRNLAGRRTYIANLANHGS